MMWHQYLHELVHEGTTLIIYTQDLANKISTSLKSFWESIIVGETGGWTPQKIFYLFTTNQVIWFSDLIDLWVIKIEKPMILCTCSTSRSDKQSTKCRWRSENMYKVWIILQSRKDFMTIKHGRPCFEKSQGALRFVGFIFLIAVCWLAGQVNTDRMESMETYTGHV